MTAAIGGPACRAIREIRRLRRTFALVTRRLSLVTGLDAAANRGQDEGVSLCSRRLWNHRLLLVPAFDNTAARAGREKAGRGERTDSKQKQHAEAGRRINR